MFEGQVAFYLNKYLGVFMSMYCVLMFVYCVFFQWCLPFVMHAQQATSLLYLLPWLTTAGKYLNGLDAESLRISVWKGDVELRNLTLKPEALQDLDLPCTVKAGLLGRLTLKVCMLPPPALSCSAAAG